MASDEELERTRHMVQRAPEADSTAAQESTLPLRAGAAMPIDPLPEPAFVVPADTEMTTFSLPPVHEPTVQPFVPLAAAAPAAPLVPATRGRWLVLGVVSAIAIVAIYMLLRR
jgi:hypothetical protein